MDEYDIEKAFQAIENELMASMIRNMKRHRVEEVKEGKEWSMWQAEQLKSLEEYKKRNRKKFKSKFSDINGSISAIITAARKQGSMNQEISILNAIKKGFSARKISPGTAAEFFKLNERKLTALINATMGDMKKAEAAVLRMTEDQYRKTIFNAQVYANSGAGTYEQAVDMATKDFLSRGINCIEYKNGARHTISSYAAMAIRTASKRAYLQGEGEKRQEWGVSTVIMNKRGNACLKCLPFVGKVLIDDVWSGGKQSDGPYMLMSSAMAAGLYHPNCKDVHTTYFPGISTPGAAYTKKELSAIEEDYRKFQKEQYADKQVEKFGRLADNSLDEENQRRYAARREEWKRRQAERENILNTDEQQQIRRRREEWKRRNAENKEEIPYMPNFSEMSTSQISDWANKNLKTVFVDTAGVNSEFMAEAAKVISEFEQKMGGETIDGLKVKFGGLPRGVYAKYDDSTKTLLLKKTGSKKAFEQSQLEENARSRFKLRNFELKQSKDYHATETYSGTIWHELGHAVDTETGQEISRSLSRNADLDVKSVRISQYAGTTQGVRVTKRSEAWAENFAAYMDGGVKAREVPEEIREMIDGYFSKSVAKHSDSAMIKLSDPERYAVNQYISFGSYGINEKLRNGLKLNELENRMMMDLDSALKKIPNYEGNLSRSLYLGSEEKIKEYLSGFKVGESISFKEFLSTTNAPVLYNPEGEVQIYIQSAKSGRDLTSVNMKESEVLYERGSEFMVENIVEHEGKYWILMEEI